MAGITCDLLVFVALIRGGGTRGPSGEDGRRVLRARNSFRAIYSTGLNVQLTSLDGVLLFLSFNCQPSEKRHGYLYVSRGNDLSRNRLIKIIAVPSVYSGGNEILILIFCGEILLIEDGG